MCLGLSLLISSSCLIVLGDCCFFEKNVAESTVCYGTLPFSPYVHGRTVYCACAFRAVRIVMDRITVVFIYTPWVTCAQLALASLTIHTDKRSVGGTFGSSGGRFGPCPSGLFGLFVAGKPFRPFLCPLTAGPHGFVYNR